LSKPIPLTNLPRHRTIALCKQSVFARQVVLETNPVVPARTIQRYFNYSGRSSFQFTTYTIICNPEDHTSIFSSSMHASRNRRRKQSALTTSRACCCCCTNMRPHSIRVTPFSCHHATSNVAPNRGSYLRPNHVHVLAR
jgi:hypothetical protein